MVNFEAMSGRSSITWKMRILGCAAVLSALSSTSFALSVTTDYGAALADLAETGNTEVSKSTVFQNSRTSVPTWAETGMSSSFGESTSMMKPVSTALSPPTTTTSFSLPTTTSVSPPTTTASRPAPARRGKVKSSSTTLSLAPGDYLVSSSKLDQGTLSLTAAGAFTLSITLASTVSSATTFLPRGKALRSVVLSYNGPNDIVISGSLRKGGSVLQGILVALNSTVSPVVIVNPNVPPPSPPPIVGDVGPIVPDSGSTGILLSLSGLALLWFRPGIPSRLTRRPPLVLTR